MNRFYKISFLLAVTCAGLIAAYLIPPLAQDPSYHNFADQRTLHGVANYWNSLSNLLFILIGLFGLYSSSRTLPHSPIDKLQTMYTLFFTGAILVGFGSAFYHLNPSNDTLVWDRLPMTISFMTFFSIIIAQYISLKAGKLIFYPMLVVGVIAVLYWHKTEQLAVGDIRPYAVIQFLPMILIPFILVLFGKSQQYTSYIWAVLIAYLLSKLSENFDMQIYEYTTHISGHSLKHLIASSGVLFFYLYFRKQIQIADDRV